MIGHAHPTFVLRYGDTLFAFNHLLAAIVFMAGTLGQLTAIFALADAFAAHMRTNMLAAVLPSVLNPV